MPARSRLGASVMALLACLAVVGVTLHFVGFHRIFPSAQAAASSGNQLKHWNLESHNTGADSIRERGPALLWPATQDPNETPVNLAITAAPLLPDASLLDAELLIWGDDHCDAVMPALRSLCKKYEITAYGASQSHTAPLIETYISDYSHPKKYYSDFNNAMFEFARRSEVKHVLLVAKWSNYVPAEKGRLPGGTEKTSSQKTFYEGLQRTVRKLHEIGVHVWIMEEVPDVELMRDAEGDSAGIPLVSHLSSVHGTARLFSELTVGATSKDRMINFLDPVLFLSDETGLCPVRMEDQLLYQDTGILSSDGAMRLRPMFSPMVSAILSDRR